MVNADTLYVGIYNQKQILRYDSNGNPIAPTPWLGTGSTASPGSIQGEGIACGMGYTPTAQEPTVNPVFIGNMQAGTVEIANANAAAGTNPIVNPSFISGLNGVANIALSKDGHYLYVAQESGNSVGKYDATTGALVSSVSFTGAHDVLVGNDGSVYVTAYGSTGPPTQGVVRFDSNLTAGSQTQFIAAGNNGLSRATGMVFDSQGNLWVANVYTNNGSVIGAGPSTTNFVSEYTSTGQYLRTVTSSGNNLYTVFGLSLGADGNIYAASFNGGEITKIDTTTYTASTFVTLPAGDTPKYATWASDCITFVPEPSTYTALFLGGGLVLMLLRRIKPQRFLRA